MRDLLVITPTRGRPEPARRLIAAMAATSTARTDLILAVDDDDPSYDGMADSPSVTVIRGPRMTCGQWTNKIAAEHGGSYRALASLGDDHVPRTPGWDTALLAAVDAMGGTGIAYPDDLGQHENLPTAPVMSSDIPAALGWMFHPGMIHYYCDNIWKDIGLGAGCLRYVPGVVIQHMHPGWNTAPWDQVYGEAAPAGDADMATWHHWRETQMAADVAAVRALMTPA